MKKPRKPNGRFCVICREALTGKQKKYCSKRCRNENFRREHWQALEIVKPGEAIRICLRCQKPFLSIGPGNRICDGCGPADIRNRSVAAGGLRAFWR